MFLGLCTLPILLKWVLIGRWKPQEIRMWSTAYLRFWLVKTLIQASPMALLIGSPLYSLYLRALGAKVGRGAVILSPGPVCTDLFSIGDSAVIRKNSVAQRLPSPRRHHPDRPGQHRHGRARRRNDGPRHRDLTGRRGPAGPLLRRSTPDRPCPAASAGTAPPRSRQAWSYQRLPASNRSAPWRPAVYTTMQLIGMLGIAAPLGLVIAVLLLKKIPQLATLLDRRAGCPRPAGRSTSTR